MKALRCRGDHEEHPRDTHGSFGTVLVIILRNCVFLCSLIAVGGLGFDLLCLAMSSVMWDLSMPRNGLQSNSIVSKRDVVARVGESYVE